MPGERDQDAAQVRVASQPAALARQAAEWLALELTRAIGERGSCALGLAGGRTPEPVYHELASASSIDWKRVAIFFSDERAVPPDHADSNYRMVRLALLSRVPIPAGQVHRMEAERPDREAAAREYERLLPAQLDVLLLGMGPDGHTASLFPGSAALDERRRLVVPVMGAKPPVERLTITPPLVQRSRAGKERRRLVVPVMGAKPPAERLTITPPVIEAARTVAVIASGRDKAAMVARAIEGPLAPKEVPAQLARRGVWLLDQAAAEQLPARGVVT